MVLKKNELKIKSKKGKIAGIWYSAEKERNLGLNPGKLYSIYLIFYKEQHSCFLLFITVSLLLILDL